MKSLIGAIFISFFAIFSPNVLSSEQLVLSETEAEQNDDARKAAIILNHLHGSLNKIVTYNDKIILEQEYDNIINNIDLTTIDDIEIIDQITYIMDVLTSHKISEIEKQWLNVEYQDKLDAALTDTLRGINVRGSNPVEMGINLLTSAGSAYYDYKQNQKNYKKQLDKATWELDKGSISEINDLRKQFIRTYWEIMKRYDIPDSWRISENQFQRFHDILKNDLGDVKLRKLLRLESELAVLPDYWFELALSAREVKEREIELNAIKRYEQLNDRLFRENSFYSQLLANKMSYMDLNTDADEIRAVLSQMLLVDRLNPERKLIAALKYIQLNDFVKAEKLLNQNIDDNFLVDVSARIKIDMYLKQKAGNRYAETIDGLINKQNIAASEYLYYLGTKPLPALVDEVKEQLEAVEVAVDSETFGKDNIKVTLSKKWVFDKIENTNVEFVLDDDNYEASELEKIDESLVYTFENSFDRDEIIEMISSQNTPEASISMVVSNIPVIINYHIIRVNVEEVVESVTANSDDNNDKESEGMLGSISSFTSKTFDTAKSATEQTYGNLKNYVTEEFTFKPVSLVANGKCFEISETLHPCE